jgi:hypothetical protein
MSEAKRYSAELVRPARWSTYAADVVGVVATCLTHMVDQAYYGTEPRAYRLELAFVSRNGRHGAASPAAASASRSGMIAAAKSARRNCDPLSFFSGSSAKDIAKATAIATKKAETIITKRHSVSPRMRTPVPW